MPVELVQIINKALEKDRELRYQHASDIRTDLQRLKRSRESAGTSAAASASAERVLQAATPKESTVGRSTEVVAMVSEIDSRGLKQYLDDEAISSVTSEDVRQRPFELDFPTDARGDTQPVEICLRLDSPDFEPRWQTKKLRVPPKGDSAPCTFLIKPLIAGELIANLELLKGEEVVSSRSLRTRCLAEGAPIKAGMTLVSIPLKIWVQASDAGVLMAQLGGVLTAQPEIGGGQPLSAELSVRASIPGLAPPAKAVELAKPRRRKAKNIGIAAGLATVILVGASTFTMFSKRSIRVNSLRQPPVPSIGVSSDVTGIEAAIGRFNNAYGSLSTDEVKRQSPTMSDSEAEAASSIKKGDRLQIGACSKPAIVADSAEVSCTEIANFDLGGKEVERRISVIISLKKTGEVWSIENMRRPSR